MPAEWDAWTTQGNAKLASLEGMIMKRNFVCLIVAVALTGRTHQALVGTASPTNFSSRFDQRISSPVTYTIESTSLTKLQKNDTVIGFHCNTHSYPVDGIYAFTGSIPAMMEAVFDNFNESKGTPQKGIIQLVFRIERFEPRMMFKENFGYDAFATVEVGLSVLGTRDGKRVFGTSVDSQHFRTGVAGPFCSRAGGVLADATREAIKDVLEKVGERLSNDQQLRLSASQ